MILEPKKKMKPPICFLCHLDFRHDPEEGGLVYFSLSEDDIEYNNKLKQQGFSRHPALVVHGFVGSIMNKPNNWNISLCQKP